MLFNVHAGIAAMLLVLLYLHSLAIDCAAAELIVLLSTWVRIAQCTAMSCMQRHPAHTPLCTGGYGAQVPALLIYGIATAGNICCDAGVHDALLDCLRLRLKPL